MARKPERLRYGPDDTTPWRVTAALAVQHAALALVFLVYPVAAVNAAGMDAAQSTAFLTACILALALGAFLQSRKPPFGSGALAMYIPSPLMIPVIAQAGPMGGAPLIAGATLVMGGTVLALGRVLRYVRVLLPAEVCGVVILMLGVAIATPALKSATGAVFGANGHVDSVNVHHALVAAGTLAGIVVATVFGRGPVKLFSLAIGLAIGLGLSAALDVFEPGALHQLDALPWFGWPHLAWVVPRFELSLVPLVVVLAVFNTVDTIGMMIGIQRMVDADWEKIDTRQCAGGVQGSGLTDTFAGALAGMGGGISSSHLGLVLATGTASRIVAACAGGVLLLAAFTPKGVALMMLLPDPVMGAIMAYTAAQMVVGGMELIQSRSGSERRMLTVGLSILAGLTPLVLPHWYSHMSPLVAPIFESSLAVSAIAAIVLNLVMRIGISQQAAIDIARSRKGHWDATEFLERMGKLWGARQDVVRRAIQATGEVIELTGASGARGDVRLEARFDEMNLDVWIDYDGPALQFPDTLAAGDDEFGLDDPAVFAGFIIRRLSDRLSQSTEGERHRLFLRFEH